VREDDLKSTFEQLRAAPMPVRGLTADDIISSGEAVRKRRRTMAVVGSGVGTTAVVVAAVLALALNQGDAPTGPVEPAGPSSTTSVQQPVQVPPSSTPLPQGPVESSPEGQPAIPSTSPSATSQPTASVPHAPVVSTTATTSVQTTSPGSSPVSVTATG
jgi:hypothetical protein